MFGTRSPARRRALRTGAVLAAVLLADIGLSAADLGPRVPAPSAVAPTVTVPVGDLAWRAALRRADATNSRGASSAATAVATAAASTPVPVPSVAAGVVPGIPERVLAAYRRAEATTAVAAPGCALRWWVLAGIGKMESDHADGGRVDAAGTTTTPIFGPWLDGSDGVAAIPSAAGAPGWERATGPMQFLPATWAAYGDGGDPQNVDDAALAAARLLCSAGTDLAEPGQLAAALFRYNPSSTYVEAVLSWARSYADGPVPALAPGAPVPTAPEHSTAATTAAAAIAVDFALDQLGLPYVWGGNGPANGDAGFDCSGLTHAAYVAAGIPTPRTAQTQYDAGPLLRPDAPLQPGDLVFFGTPSRVHHVGMYVGDNRMINAPTFGKPVRLAGFRWSGDDFVGASRPAARPGSLPLVLPPRTSPRVGAVPRPGPAGPPAAAATAPVGAPAPVNGWDPEPAAVLPLVGPLVGPLTAAAAEPATPGPTTGPAGPTSAVPTPPVPPVLLDPRAPRPPQIPAPVLVLPTPTSAVPKTTTPPTTTPAPAPARTSPPRTTPTRTPAAPTPVKPTPVTPTPVTPTAPVPNPAVPPPTMTRAEAVALFATAGYARRTVLVYRDATSGRIVVLVRPPAALKPG